MRFEKWQGLGNDFILTEESVSPEEAMRLCHRRRGIGGDGVLCITRDPTRMVVLNADGSRPEMCGNGLRCVAGWLAERELITAQTSVETDAGPRACEVKRTDVGQWDVRANMGPAKVTGELEFDGHRFALVNVGNPHAVCFEPLSTEEVDHIGPAVEAHVDGGVNVELCTARDDGGYDVRVFERGVGWTDACGTGACAVAAAAVAGGAAKLGTEVAVWLPGGTLVIEVTAETVFMRGPAVRVYAGEFG